MRKVRETIYEPTISIRGRIGQFVLLLSIIFIITAVVVITQRLSDDTLALIIGLLIAGVPLSLVIALLGFILFRKMQQPAVTHRPVQQQTIPPIIVQMPQPLPQQTPPTHNWMVPAQRQWDVIGHEE